MPAFTHPLLHSMFSYSEAAERNRAPILAVLEQVLLGPGTVLEIGSGTGQHAVYLSHHLPHLIWQPTDVAEHLPDIAARSRAEGAGNLLAPLELDVAWPSWPVEQVDAVYAANVVHIVSWQHVIAMFAGIGRHLRNGGLLCLYGPYRYDGAFTTESNRRFDQWLKQRDPASGIRDFESVDALAAEQGLSLIDDHAMPANNQLLVWRRIAAT